MVFIQNITAHKNDNDDFTDLVPWNVQLDCDYSMRLLPFSIYQFKIIQYLAIFLI